MPFAAMKLPSRCVEAVKPYIPVQAICPCHSVCTVMLRDIVVTSMSATVVTATASVVSDSVMHREAIADEPLWDQRCAHDVAHKVHVTFSMVQWDSVVSKMPNILLVKCMVRGIAIDVSEQGNVIPAMPGGRIHVPHNEVDSIELFAGGFSGWTQAIRLINDSDELISIHHRLAVEHDAKCVKAYSLGHYADIVDETHVVRNVPADVKEERVVQSDVMDPEWLHLIGHVAPDMAVLSPPCPPWSQAFRPVGLDREDGMLTIHGWAICYLLGVKVVVMENVKGMHCHADWPILRYIFDFLGYEVRWVKTCNLQEQCPQQRERLLVIATSRSTIGLNSHICQSWVAKEDVSLRNYDAIMNLDMPWVGDTRVDGHPLEMYLNPIHLPKRFQQTSKRTRLDVEKYRLKTPDDVASCFLAQYRWAHELPEHVIYTGGLLGCLLVTSRELRFFSSPEIALTLGACKSFWLPEASKDAYLLVGNAISIPHASIAICNALAFLLEDMTDQESVDLHELMMQRRFTASTLSWKPCQDGFLFDNKRGDEEAQIAPTVFPSPFYSVHVTMDNGSFSFMAMPGVVPQEVIATLMGITPEVVQASLQFSPLSHPHKYFSMMSGIIVEDNDIILQLKGSGLLQINPKCFDLQEDLSKYVIALTHMAPVVFLRSAELTLQKLTALLTTTTGIEQWSITGLFRDPIQVGRPVPRCVMAIPSPLDHIDTQGFQRVEFSQHGDSLLIRGRGVDVELVVSQFRELGIMHTLASVGWQLVQPIPFLPMDDPSDVLMLPKPESLSIPIKDAVNCLITQLFTANIHQIQQVGDRPSMHVVIKFGPAVLWMGGIDPTYSLIAFHDAFRRVSAVIGDGAQMRFIYKGKMVVPDIALQEYLDHADYNRRQIIIHGVLSLKGGAPKTDAASPAVRLVAHDKSAIPNRERSPLPRLRKHEPPTDKMDAKEEQAHFSKVAQDMFNDWLQHKPQDIQGDVLNFLSCPFHGEQQYFLSKADMHKHLELVQFFKTNGIERVLDHSGWLVLLHYVDFQEIPTTWLYLMPEPGVDALPIQMISTFLKNVFMVLAFPKISHLIGETALLKFKLFDTVIFHDYVPISMPLQLLMDAWNQACTLLDCHHDIRFIASGKQLSQEFLISDYARPDKERDGEYVISIHTVGSLRRGAGPTPEFVTATKNKLATFLLHDGASLDEVNSFVNDSMQYVGAMAVDKALSAKQYGQKWNAIHQFAHAHQLKIPSTKAKHSKFQEKVRQKFNGERTRMIDALAIADVSFQKGFFVNEDDSHSNQLREVRPGASGICIMKEGPAKIWLQQPSPISQDELAIMVLGECPSQDGRSCQKVQAPCFDAVGQPLVLAGCLHQLGKKQVRLATTSTTTIDVGDTVVIAITMFRDETTPDCWSKLQTNPVRRTIEIMNTLMDEVSFTSPPWGRSFQKGKAKVLWDQAETFQYHARILKKDLLKYLKVSGQKAIYVTPKTESKQIDRGFQIVWLSMDDINLAVAASAYDHHCGLVRATKAEAKVQKGIRFRSQDFRKCFQELRPNDPLPSEIICNFYFKLAPTPTGATQQQVQQWLDVQKWNAKPLRTLSSNTWLCGTPAKFSAVFAQWNNQTLLVRWLASRAQAPPVILAGKLPTLKSEVKNPKVDPLQREDPWATYLHLNGPAASGTGSSVPNAVQRRLDAPVEQKFEQQAQELANVQQEVSQIKEQMAKQIAVSDQRHEQTKTEFGLIRSEAKNQFSQLSTAFNESIAQATQRQEKSLASQFAEIKSLIQSQIGPPAAQARKTTPREGQEGGPKEDDDI